MMPTSTTKRGPVLVLALTALACALLAPGAAQASYEEHLMAGPARMTAAGSQMDNGLRAGLTEQGRKGEAKAVGSVGKAVPAADALALIIPQGWICSGFTPQKGEISWTASEPWTDVLARLAAASQLHYALDWEKKQVRIAPAGANVSLLPAPQKAAAVSAAAASPAKTPASAAPAKPAETAAPKAAQQKPEAAPAKTAAAALKPKVPAGSATAQALEEARAKVNLTPDNAVRVPMAAKTFQVGPGSLRAQLETWCADAGFRLLWTPDTDLELEAGATFQGPFPQAVRQLFETLRGSGSPFTAHLYHGNRVLRVEER